MNLVRLSSFWFFALFASGAVIEITSPEQFEEVLRKNDRVATDFTATWCSPCHLIGPSFRHLSEDYKNIVFISVDVDKVAPVAQKYSIRTMPTFMFFRDGEKIDDLLGANKEGLEAKVESLAS
ncbi:thioredoxin [Aspergillus parasiticus]|uniref:Thioredoxin n=1 Tax=Aspergillus parasiticus TaxID=5067 RepID=A0A5N6DVQ3_ASPPA|nr:thioredoxin [Aspergillus parasiticus]